MDSVVRQTRYRTSVQAVTPIRASIAPNEVAGKSKLDIPPVLGGLKAGFKKLCVVTGASSGLGRETAKALTEKDGYFVICAVRDVEKMKQVAAEIGLPPNKHAILELELSSLASVRKFVFNLKAFKSNRPLDRLVCNAAVYLPKDPEPSYSEDGYEMSMAVNHLGHFLLCNLLLEDMAKAKDARMIIVGSITGNSNTVGGGLVYPRADVGEFQGWETDGGKMIPMVDGTPFFGAKAYKDSKVCNMMTVSQLHERYHESTGITFSSIYPGCIAETALFREKRAWFRKGFPLFMKYVTGGYVGQQEAGERLAQVVDDPICSKSGVYWSWNGGAKQVGVYDRKSKSVVGAGGSGGEIFENDQSDQVTNRAKGERMWELSSKLCGCEWPEIVQK
eukprot:CAMPEP_0185766260 /NCGR_PEP_ID=MMETSP1174-20130828/35803_1 /TAXON_ID=35687 /ORGANISM="Dictyocha speculum, Strain CCMP1381" /LENGTH=389 /DNA_ID=CAMNT_0028449839 /DNA_START=102 /DNA_END=1271 /DNA_ORIENTATION=-